MRLTSVVHIEITSRGQSFEWSAATADGEWSANGRADNYKEACEKAGAHVTKIASFVEKLIRDWR